MSKTDDTFWAIIKADQIREDADKKIIEGWDKPLPWERGKKGRKK